MEEFGLGGEVVHEKEVEPTKALFRDKKLTRLWEKVEHVLASLSSYM